MPENNCTLDIGADDHDYRPVSFIKVKGRIEGQIFKYSLK